MWEALTLTAALYLAYFSISKIKQTNKAKTPKKHIIFFFTGKLQTHENSSN